MPKCPVCNKQKSTQEMRPLLNVKELNVGGELTEQKTKRKVGDIELDIVCRTCWDAIVKNQTKEDLIEMLETFGSLLIMELAQGQPYSSDPGILEKMLEKHVMFPAPPYQPSVMPNQPPVIYTDKLTVAGGSWQSGGSVGNIQSGDISCMSDQASSIDYAKLTSLKAKIQQAFNEDHSGDASNYTEVGGK